MTYQQPSSLHVSPESSTGPTRCSLCSLQAALAEEPLPLGKLQQQLAPVKPHQFRPTLDIALPTTHPMVPLHRKNCRELKGTRKAGKLSVGLPAKRTDKTGLSYSRNCFYRCSRPGEPQKSGSLHEGGLTRVRGQRLKYYSPEARLLPTD